MKEKKTDNDVIHLNKSFILGDLKQKLSLINISFQYSLTFSNMIFFGVSNMMASPKCHIFEYHYLVIFRQIK